MEFEYITVLISVVVGLALTHFLSHVVNIIHRRDEVIVSWAQLLWALALVVWTIAFWWFTFVFTRVEEMTFGLFLFVLVYAVFLYILLALLFPPDGGAEHDYRKVFLRNRRWFYCTYFVFLLYDIGDYLIKLEADVSIVTIAPYALFVGSQLVGAAIGVFTARLWFHRLFALYVLLFQFYLVATTLGPLSSLGA